MRMQSFSVYDSKASAYMLPWFMQSPGEAQRAFTEMVNDPRQQNALTKYPEDFTLFHLGEWDDSTGQFHPFKTPKPLCKALEVKKAPQPDPQLSLIKEA